MRGRLRDEDQERTDRIPGFAEFVLRLLVKVENQDEFLETVGTIYWGVRTTRGKFVANIWLTMQLLRNLVVPVVKALWWLFDKFGPRS